MPLEEYTVAEAFQDAGYTTFFAGKWHLGDDEQLWPEHQGFDINIGGWRYGSLGVGPGQFSHFAPCNNPRLEEGPKMTLSDKLTNRSYTECSFINTGSSSKWTIYC